MAKQWIPPTLSVAEEKLLIDIGQADHVFATDQDHRFALLDSLRNKGLVFKFTRQNPAASDYPSQAWAVTSEGFFTFKYLLRERIPGTKKGGRA